MVENDKEIMNRLGKELSHILDGQELRLIIPVLARSLAFAIIAHSEEKADHLTLLEHVVENLIDNVRHMQSQQAVMGMH